MIQGLDILKKLVAENKLVENLSTKELKDPENAGFDLRLGELYSIKGDAFIGVEDRKTPEGKLASKFEKSQKNSIIIKPGEYFLGKTVEKINTPDNLFGIYFFRSTYWRSGINLVSGMLGPGYKGEVSFPITNLGKSNVEIEMGARIIHIFFIKIEGKSSAYRGLWQGGKIVNPKIAKQDYQE